VCGIAGIFDPARATPGGRLAELAVAMAGTLHHRGPDDEGVWVDAAAGVALGFRRLAILDLSDAGHQPMRSPAGRYTMAFNGEIYTHGELRRSLAPDVQLRGHSDTEVLLATMDERGVHEALRETNGMFALAVFDARTGELHLARDRLGEKPLYYGWAGRSLVFGSELKALRAHPDMAATIDRGALALFLRYTFVPAPHTIHQGIRKLLPGTTLTFTPEATPGRLPPPRPYWRLPDIVATRSQARVGGPRDLAAGRGTAVDALHDLLLDSTALRMTADVPVGAFLSGGVDSSTVVALMQAAHPDAKVRTFTVAMPDFAFDESAAAGAVAHHLGTEHTTVELTAAEALAVIPELPRVYDEPFADPSQIPCLLVARAARQHMTVALTGDGGDEAFVGYNRYVLGDAVWRRVRRLPPPLRRGLRRGLLAVRPDRVDRLVRRLEPVTPTRLRLRNPGDKAQKLARLLDLPWAGDVGGATSLYRALVSEWPDPAALALGAPEPSTFADTGGHLDGLEPAASPVGGTGFGAIERMVFLDQLGVLPDGMLTKVDRASMAASLECRLPLLDHRVVERAWSLPLGWHLHDGRGKQLLRSVLDRYVPPELIDRPKMGFDPPIGAWLRGPLRDWGEALLDRRRLADEGWLDPGPVRQRWDEHQQRARNWDYALWTVLQFQAWLEAS
jgi:asparagine synthase (glutamine-hydrolysing)